MNELALTTIEPKSFEKVFDGLDISEATCKDYKQRILVFVGFMENRELTHNTFLEFKRHLADNKSLSVASKNKYLTTARIFLREIHRQGFLPVDITINIKSFQQSQKHKKAGLTNEEITKVLEYLNNQTDSLEFLRMKSLFCLLAFQGLRQIEITRLCVSDIDFVRQTAFVQGKGQDDKELIHLDPKTTKALKKYLKISEISHGNIFQSHGNRKSPQISTRTIQRIFGQIFDLLSIDKTVHGFRHYYITKLLQNFEVRDVRKFSRHRSLEMLIIYDDELDMSQKSQEVFKCFSGLNFA